MNLFKRKEDIIKFNLVNQSNQVTPHYNVRNPEVYFKLYLSPEEEICILGKLDNNYIVWCSITKLSDRKTNAKIFNYIAGGNFKLFSTEYGVLGSDQSEKISKWYECRILKSTIPGYSWNTPFGHYYGNDDPEDHGEFFSGDLQSFFKEQLMKCEFRMNKGRYLEVLTNYLDILTIETDDGYYCRIKSLISILEDESYLRLCQDMQVRILYLKCMEVCGKLYCRYMTVVR